MLDLSICVLPLFLSLSMSLSMPLPASLSLSASQSLMLSLSVASASFFSLKELSLLYLLFFTISRKGFVCFWKEVFIHILIKRPTLSECDLIN